MNFPRSETTLLFSFARRRRSCWRVCVGGTHTHTLHVHHHPPTVKILLDNYPQDLVMEHGRDLEEAAEHRGGNFPSDALFLPNPLRLVFSPLGADGPRWNVTSARTILQSQKILPLTNMWLQVILLILPLWCSSAPTTDSKSYLLRERSGM